MPPSNVFDPTNTCCRTLRQAAKGLLGVPSDIGLLLPILAAYMREEEMKTVVELGSRLGSSSMTLLNQMRYNPDKRFATVDLEIRQPVAAMYRCEALCTETSSNADVKRNRKFFTVEGNDLTVPIPFVDETKLAEKGGSPNNGNNNNYRPIDLLFIDTLHHAALLKLELKRYPRFVRKYLVFHDSYSFRTRNEGPRNFKPPGWPPGEPIPVGLQVVLREFLEAHKDEWIEEMNNVHNNGFFVIRRRSEPPAAQKWVLDVGYARYSGIEVEPAEGIEMLLRKGSPSVSPDALCDRAYADMYKFLGVAKEQISPPCHQAPGFTLRNHLTPLYNLLIAAKDKDLPIAPYLPLIASQVTAPLTLDPDAQVVVMGCEISVANAAMHGALQARKAPKFYPFAGYSSSEKENECASDRLIKYLRKHSGDATVVADAKDIFGKPRSVDVLVLSATALDNIGKSDEHLAKVAAAVKHRVVVYGTNLVNIQKEAKYLTVEDGGGDVFELRLGLERGVGLVMFERRFSTAYVYAPGARPKKS